MACKEAEEELCTPLGKVTVGESVPSILNKILMLAVKFETQFQGSNMSVSSSR